MAGLGLLGVSVPAEYGGAGMDYISLGIASEELEYVDTSLRVILSVHVGPELPVAPDLGHRGAEAPLPRAAGAGREDRHLRRSPSRRPAATRAASRPTAVKQGDRYVLNGEKMWISLADVADHFLVIAWSDLEKKRQRDTGGLSAFIVERALQGVLERDADREVGHPRRQHRLPQVGRRRGSRRRTSSAARARASRSRCSRSIRAATPWPPAPPA